MAYRFDRDETVTQSIRRVMREEARSAARRLKTAPPAERDDAIHEARKSVKKMRAAIRLVRGELGSAGARENRRLRNAARRLSELRDAQVMIEMIDALKQSLNGAAAGRALARIRAAFVARKRQAGSAGAARTLSEVAAALERTASAASNWRLEAGGFPALSAGLARTYRLGRKALALAEKNPTGEHFHEWRKRVKDHWYHLRLLAGRLGRDGARRERQFRELSEALGEEHNLAVLCGVLADSRMAGRAALLQLARARQAALREETIEAGRALYDATPQSFVRRLKRLWRTAPGTRAQRAQALGRTA
jgi:CHAD domain-containing protein